MRNQKQESRQSLSQLGFRFPCGSWWPLEATAGTVKWLVDDATALALVPVSTHWTFPLSLHPEERFLLTLPPSGTYIQGLVSLLWEISDSTGVLCPCGPCCAPTGLSLCWELGSGSALCWTARNVQSWFSYYYYFMFIECLMAPGWPTASWDRAISPNSTLLRPL